MSNIRIKDLSTEATSLGTDDFIPVDGNTSGTRKISKENLGTTLEIPDVGSAANEVSLNGMLGDMAFQSSDGVSVAKAEIESTTGTATTQALTVTDGTDTNFVVQEDGKTGIGGVTPSTTLHIRSDSDKNLELGTLGNKASIAALNDARSAYVDMRIDADNLIIGNYSGGKVGIGTASPDRPLHSYASSVATALKLDSAGIDTGVEFAHSGTVAAAINCSTGGDLEFRTGANSGANERLRIDSSGKVGIGTDSPGSYSGNADDLVVYGGATIATASGGASHLYFADGTSGIRAYAGFLTYNHTAEELRFGVGGVTKWRINSLGNLVAGSGGAIDFGSGATTTLDTYEEGFHTATLTPASSGTMTLGTGADTLAYTRIGRTVTITGRLQLSSVSSPVGDYFKISLPTGIGVGNLTDAAGSLTGSCFVFNAAGNSGDYSVLGLEGDAFLRVYKNTNPSATATAADFSGDESIYLGVTYITA